MNPRILGTAILFLIVGVVIGLMFGGRTDHDSGEASAGAGEPLYWVAPMDPDYRRDGPGKSPMGMDLVPVFEAPGAETGVRISPEVAHNFGVRVEPARRTRLDTSVRTLATVMLDEAQIHHVHTRSAGWIERLVANVEGDPVAAGDVLLELYAPELVRAQEDYLTALRAGEPALRRAAGERLRTLGMTPTQIAELEQRGRAQERVALRSDQDGFVMDLAVREGMYVQPSTQVLAVAGLDPIWVIAEVFERDIAAIAPGQRARLSFDFLPDREFDGTVDYLYPELDMKARTLRVRMVFPNPDAALKPGMFGSVSLLAAPGDAVLTVPASSVIRGLGDTPDRVVVEISPGRFRSRAVRLGRVAPERIEIRAGLREGERVVTSGQFLIDSESDIDTDLLRMGAGAADADGAMDHGAMNHEAMDHDAMDHGSMNHEGMDHEAMDHGSMSHEGMDHEAMDHGSMNHEGMDHEAMDHGSMNHEGMDHEAVDHGSMEHPGAEAEGRAGPSS